MIPAALLVALFLAFTVHVHPGEWRGSKVLLEPFAAI
jgi:hypothetical protein